MGYRIKNGRKKLPNWFAREKERTKKDPNFGISKRSATVREEEMGVMDRLKVFVVQEPVITASCLIAGFGISSIMFVFLFSVPKF